METSKGVYRLNLKSNNIHQTATYSGGGPANPGGGGNGIPGGKPGGLNPGGGPGMPEAKGGRADGGPTMRIFIQKNGNNIYTHWGASYPYRALQAYPDLVQQEAI